MGRFGLIGVFASVFEAVTLTSAAFSGSSPQAMSVNKLREINRR
jgi:hypothetical protein